MSSINIVGDVSYITFHNEDFYIMKVKTNKGSTTVKGNYIGNVSVGQTLKFTGSWNEHKKYGKFFEFEYCEPYLEKTKDSIIKYISYNIDGIGITTARRLYDHFGDNVIEILAKDQDKLKEAKFLNKSQVSSIKQYWSVKLRNNKASVKLLRSGVKIRLVKKIIERFGESTYEVINENPYKLIEVDGISFNLCDSMAILGGIDKDSDHRYKAIVINAIDMSRLDGNAYVLTKDINKYVSKMFWNGSIPKIKHDGSFPDYVLVKILSDLKNDGIIVVEGDKVYKTVDYNIESYIARIVNDMINTENEYLSKQLKSIEESVKDFEKNNKIQLSKNQKLALDMLTKSKFCVVSGFPGSGKTTVVSAFIYIFEKAGINYELMSPTGIAAKRLSIVTNREANTIHRALGYNGESWQFNENNKYDIDAVVIDEVSMLDNSTFLSLLKALKPTTMVIAIGDNNQLPSVGIGDVLNQLMQSSRVESVKLTKVFRQSHQSDIVEVASSILSNDRVSTKYNPKSEFVFIQRKPQDIFTDINNISRILFEKGMSFQVMSPMYKGNLGVDNLNELLRPTLNDKYEHKKNIKFGKSRLYVGDRVMFIKNDYNNMIYNGDIGKVEDMNIKDSKIKIKVFNWFDGDSYSDTSFNFSMSEVFSNIRVSYACTVHKVQGQEFDAIIMPIVDEYRIMLYRNLIYTAITRAKKRVFIIGQTSAFNKALSNERKITRNSSINEMIDR